MRFRLPYIISLLAFLVLSTTLARAQDVVHPEEQVDESLTVRGVFFATRPSGASKKSSTVLTAPTNRNKTNSGGVKPSATDSKRTSVAAKGNNAQRNKASSSSSKSNNASNAKSVVPSPASIGLGYTLYMRDASGGAVRVDPSRQFKAGEQIRIALETNSDGYLYIFHTEDGRNPQMLYPDVRLNDGSNNVRAHVPYQVPSSLNDWFRFDANPATERLYIVVARQPLPGIPAGEELKTIARSRLQTHSEATVQQIISNCKLTPDLCTWRPTPDAWAQVAKASSAPAMLEKSVAELGQLQTSNERDATVRGISLSQDEPAPSVVRMSASSDSNLLVTVIDLVHK